MTRLFYIICWLLLVIGCKNETTIVVDDEKEISLAPRLNKGCYGYEKDGTSIKFNVSEVGDIVSGSLDISIHEKDRNHGVFTGAVHGNKVIGVYTFESEAIKSTREMAFLITDSGLYEGYGEMDKNGTVFKDTSAINYTSSMPLRKTSCSN